MLLSNADAAYTAYDAAIVANKSSDQIVRNVLELKIGQVRPAQVPPQVLLNSDEASAATDMAGEGSQ